MWEKHGESCLKAKPRNPNRQALEMSEMALLGTHLAGICCLALRQIAVKVFHGCGECRTPASSKEGRWSSVGGWASV